MRRPTLVSIDMYLDFSVNAPLRLWLFVALEDVYPLETDNSNDTMPHRALSKSIHSL